MTSEPPCSPASQPPNLPESVWHLHLSLIHNLHQLTSHESVIIGVKEGCGSQETPLWTQTQTGTLICSLKLKHKVRPLAQSPIRIPQKIISIKGSKIIHHRLGYNSKVH